MSRFRFKSAFVFDGGYVEATEPTTDENPNPLTHTMTFAPGVYDMGIFDKMLPYFDLNFVGIFCSDASGRMQSIRSERHGDTGATPNWQPSSNVVAEREIRRIASEMVEASLKRNRKKRRKARREEQQIIDVPESAAIEAEQPIVEDVVSDDNQPSSE